MAESNVFIRLASITKPFVHRSHNVFSLLIVLALLGLAASQQCPGRCTCGGSVANCRSKSLTAPPKSYPANTKIINLEQNHIRILGSRSFHRGQTAEVLKLSGNKITAIRNDAFRTFPHLMLLDLQGNKISRVYPRAFARMRRLRTLSLNRNKIRRITGMFRGTPKIRQLNLASNKITSLGQNDLAPMSRIHNLDLRDNKITFIHPGAFEQLQNLRYLFLNNNPIAKALNLQFGTTVLQLVDISNSELPKVPQAFPSSVTDLRLGRNKIMQINHTDFQNINDLQMIALNNNELHFLADGTFSHLSELKEIWLRGNNLVYVPRDIPANVEKLHMDSNRIQEIEAGLFGSDSMLSFLSVENNQLRRINPDTFTGMANLMTINLQGNRLQTLETGTFANLNSLHSLLLSNNPLGRLEANAFQNLPNLTHLHISYLTPEATEIEGNFLPAMPQLQTLQIMASPGMGQAVVDMVESATERDFAIMPSLKTLDLSYNNLQWFSPRFRIMFPNVESVLLDGNPFHCTERLTWLQEWLTSSTNIKFHNYEDLKCQTPESLRGRDIQSLTPEEWRNGGVTADRDLDLSRVRPRSKRRHHHTGDGDGKEQEVESASRSAAADGESYELRRRYEEEQARRRQYEASLRSRTSSQEVTKPANINEAAMRSMALRAQRAERRRKMRNRSRSRSRKGGRKGRKRRGRKGKKNRRRKGKKQGRRSRSNVKRESVV